MNTGATKILFADSDKIEVDRIRQIISQGHDLTSEVSIVSSLHSAIQHALQSPCDVVLLDLALPGYKGVEAIHTFRQHAPDVALIALTSINSNGLSFEALQAGAQDYLHKETLFSSKLVRAIRYAIERKKSDAALRESEERARLALEAAELGAWDWDLRTGIIHLSKEFEVLFDYKPGAFDGKYSTLEKRVHPDDVAERSQAIAHALHSKTSYDHEYRIIWDDGSVHWIHSKGSIICDAKGMPARVLGIVRDQTHHRNAQEELNRSRRLYQSLIEMLPEGVSVSSLEGRITFVSPRLAKMFGLDSPNEALGTYALQWIAPEYHARALEKIREFGRRDTLSSNEYVLVRKDQTRFLGEITSSQLRDEHNNPVGLISIHRDISDRKKSEDERLKTEEDMRIHITAMEAASNAIVLTGTDGKIQWVNKAFEKLTGYSAQETIGNNPRVLRSGLHDNAYYKSLWDTILAGQTWHSEIANRRKSGEIYYEEMTITPVLNARGEIIRFIAIKQDVTDRKRAEAELQFRNLLLSSQQEASVDGILVVDEHKRILTFNRRYVQMWRIPAELVAEGDHSPLLNHALTQVVDPQSFMERIQSIYAHREETSQEELLLADGRIFDRYTAPLWGADNRYFGRVWYFRDITDQRKGEKERRQLAAAIDQADEIVVITDTRMSIQYVNPAFERIFGYSRDEIIGQTPKMFVSGKHDDAYFASMLETLEQGNTWKDRTLNVRKDGTTFMQQLSITPVVDEAGKISNYVSVGRDITAEIELEKQLIQSQKMESLGTLASGIAHDFNNILGIIMGTASMLEMSGAQSGGKHGSVDSILKASKRGASLVKQILAFARKSKSELSPIHVNATLKEFAAMISSTFPLTIRVDLDLGKDLPILMLDPTQLHQVLLNLCVNARDAILGDSRFGNGNEGQIILGSSMIDGESLRKRLPEVHARKYVTISISDNGPGIGDDIKQKIFDPFFTTKPPGEGTGLGLAVVYGIARAHQALVEVISESGKGAQFLLHFPIDEAGVKEIQTQSVTEAVMLKGTETLLIVEDDAMVRDMVTHMLERAGYKLIIAKDGKEGIELFQQHHSGIDLVITDMNMPRVNGLEFMNRAKEISPSTKFIISSGYLELEDNDSLNRIGAAGIVQKPFHGEQLKKEVRRVLDEEKKLST